MGSDEGLTFKMRQLLIDEVPKARKKLQEGTRLFHEGDIAAGLECLNAVYEATGQWMEKLKIPSDDVVTLRSSLARTSNMTVDEAVGCLNKLSTLLEKLFIGVLDDPGDLDNPDRMLMPSDN